MSPRPRPRRPEVLILGGGLCGLSTAYHLRRGWQLYEAGDRVGGLARSERIRGHTFDHTGHWLHLRDRGMQQLASRLLGDALVPVTRRSRIFSHGVLTRYPFQANLHGLPPEVVFQCLRDFLDREGRAAAPEPGEGAPRRRGGRATKGSSFEAFILEHFGAGIAEHFMVPYNEKLWGVHPREITDAWCQRFVPIPKRDDVLRGAVGAQPPELGYNAQFLYPREGGIEPLPRALAAALPSERVHCHAPVEAVDHRERRLRVGDTWIPYRALVSTAPLPVLCALLRSPPAAVVRAAERLRWTAVRYLNVALRAPTPEPYHWAYLPERRWPAYRVGVFSNAAPAAAPGRGASLYVELASRGTEDRDTLVRACVPMLQAAGALRRPEDLKFAELRRIEHAYVIFDAAYEKARDTLHRFLESHHIYSRGRYGSWDYGSMEDSLLQGREVASLLRKRYTLGPDDPHAD